MTAARWGRYTRGAMQIRENVREVPRGLMVHKDMKGFIRVGGKVDKDEWEVCDKCCASQGGCA